jgi:hypothetical protein
MSSIIDIYSILGLMSSIVDIPHDIAQMSSIDDTNPRLTDAARRAGTAG